MAFGQLRQVHISMPEEYDVDVDDVCRDGDDNGKDEEEVDRKVCNAKKNCNDDDECGDDSDEDGLDDEDDDCHDDGNDHDDDQEDEILARLGK